MDAISYQISPLSGHRFAIVILLEQDTPTLDFYLPIWIPGSYTRRDFAKNLFELQVSVDGRPAAWQMLSPSHWQAHAETGGQWRIQYHVYAREYSVRGCYLDDRRAIFNPCCACCAISGRENSPHSLCWLPDSTRADWTIHGGSQASGLFHSPDYQTLIDTPLMLGTDIRTAVFEAGGIEHEIAITGDAGENWQFERLICDTAHICREAIKIFDSLPNTVRRYSFLLFLTENDYGGLEHQDSTLLIAPRRTLPKSGETTASYLQLLGLFSHEYFHTWNVKSLRPREYSQGYRLTSEQPSQMLWFFEGFTAYFDNLLLHRSGVITAEEYLHLLGADIGRYLQRSGRLRQTLAQSSFEAWTKLYNGGENAANASTSYYVHGSLAAWCIDMALREASADCTNLASLLAALWQNPTLRRQGIGETDFLQTALSCLPAAEHTAFRQLLQRLIHSTESLPLAETAARAGLNYQCLSPISADDTGTEAPAGIRASSEPGIRWREERGRLLIRITDPDSPALQAGLAAGDEIISINSERASADSLWRLLCKNRPGTTVRAAILRDGIEYRYCWPLLPPEKNTCLLSINEHAGSREQARRRQWFNQALD